MKPFKKYLSLWVIVLAACSVQPDNPSERLFSVISHVRHSFAPDPRLSIFRAQLRERNGSWVLSGETNLPEAERALLDSLQHLGLQVIDSMEVLPSFLLGNKVYALVNNSVSNLRAEAGHHAELISQAMLGTPLKVYKKQGGWYLVQTPDELIAWIDAEAVVLMDESEIEVWKSNKKVIFTELFGRSYLNPHFTDRTESDLVMGCVLEKVGEDARYFEVAYPDGRLAYVSKKESSELGEWLGRVENNPEQLVQTAYSFFGFPFLWGGTSPKGIDGSGFTKTLFYINGTIIPRDLQQQLRSGKAVDTSGGLENLKAGDLVFFGSRETPDAPTHVGLWLGHEESFMHVAGRVRINSLNPESPVYDQELGSKLLHARRYFSGSSEFISMIPLKRIYLAGQGM